MTTISLAQQKSRMTPAAWRAHVARLQAERLGLDADDARRAVDAAQSAHADAPVSGLPRRVAAGTRLTEAQIRRLARDILMLVEVDRAAPKASETGDKLELEPGAPTQAVGVDELLQIAGADDGMVAEPDHRGTQAVKLLRKIVRSNPDAALALSTVKRLAATDWTLRAYEIGPDGPTDREHDEATAEARRLLGRVMRSHEGGGLSAMLSVGLDSIVTDGAVAFELDVMPKLDDVRDIVPVDPTVVRWQTATLPDGARVLRPVFKPQTGDPRPFNVNQFCYSGLDTTVTDPHGRPWILPVLDTAPAQHNLRNTLHKVMRHQGYGRLAGIVDHERVAQQIPVSARTPDERRAYMRRVLDDLTKKLRDLRPDDAVALYDFVRLEVVGAGHGTHSLKTQETTDVYDTDNAAALKTPPSLLGRAIGTSLSTNSDIHWWVYALAIEALREHVVRVVEWALGQYLRIRGYAAYVSITFEPIRKTDAASDETAAKTKQERLVAAMDVGLVDDGYVRTEMGYPEPTAPLPAATPAPARGAGSTGLGAAVDRGELDEPRAGVGSAQLVVGLVTTCTHCGTPNLRRPNGQGRCRKCGAYLCARRSAVEEPEPNLEAVIVEVAADATARALPPNAAREMVEAYADTVAALGIDDRIDCPECDPTVALPRAAKFEPAKATAASAVELGQAFALPDEDDGAEAAEAWREWAAARMPALTEVLAAGLYEESDDEDHEDDRSSEVDLVRADTAAKGWMWDARIQGYREAANPKRVLSEATIERAVERRLADHRALIRGLTEKLGAGDISVANWQRGMAGSLRETHLQLRMLAVGGKDRMTPRHYGSVGGMIRADTDRLARFGQAVARGELSMPQIQARAQLYGQANLRREYDRGREMLARDAGWALERRVLNAGAEHCKGCSGEASLGFVEIGTLAPIGGHECRSGDRCRIERRYSAAEARPPKPKNKKGARDDAGRVRDFAQGWQGRGPARLANARIPINGARG